MTSILIGSGSTIPSDANELSKLAVWALEHCYYLQPKRRYSIPFQINGSDGTQSIVNRSTAWLQKAVLWTRDYGTRYQAIWTIPLNTDWATSTGKLWTKTSMNLIDTNSPGGATQTFAPGTGGDIPSTVDTFPKLLLWIAEASRRLNSGDYIIEIDNQSAVPTASMSYVVTENHGDMLMCRYSIPLNPNFATVADEMYTQAYISSQVALPTDLKS
jgi:hypothetical protein